MSQLYHEFGVRLERKASAEPWGIRLAGGSDLNSPLIIIRVNPNSPAEKELMRGDIITKVEDYDARDLRHEDAQLLFRTQDNQIRLVVRRDNKIAMNSSKSKPISSIQPPNITPSYLPTHSPYVPHRAPSPLPRGPHSMAAACASPIDSLSHTVFPLDYPNNQLNQQPQQQQQYQHQQYQQQQQYQPYQASQSKPEPHVNYPPAPPPRTCFSPQLNRDQYQGFDDDNAALQHQVVHKQFNSPIGLYSDNLIETTIKSAVSPSQSVGSSSVPIFVDMSFLEQKKRILEQQQEIQRQNQQNKHYYGQSYSQKPQFNRPLSAAPRMQPSQQATPPSYPPAFHPNSRYSFN